MLMGYPQSMIESIERLESTRKKRLEQEIPLITLGGKTDLLKSFHPDYRPDVRSEIPVGVNRGEPATNELVDLLKGRSLIDPLTVDLDDVYESVDVLVIGGGGAGATAALFARESGARVLLATKLRFADCNTIMAEGGINACTYPGDSPVRHYVDTMGGGGFTNIPALVRALVEDSPKIIKWLEQLGVPFLRKPDGTYLNRPMGGGHSRARGHSVGDYTGMSIMQTLRDELLNKQIEILEFSPVVDLLLDDRRNCAGAVLLNLETGKFLLVKSKTTIICTGGIGRLHIQGFPTTNHYGATADGIVAAYRAGAKLIYADSIQFHPTGTCYPPQLIGLLVSETTRSRGAQLVNAKGERFINELETRDVVASAIIREVMENKNGIMSPDGTQGVWLDTTVMDFKNGEGFIRDYFRHLCNRFEKYDIDFVKGPVLVYPSQHYQNGGVLSDQNGQSNIPGLFVAGEVAGGVHGRNRLGGNSLADIFVFGRRAGMHAARICRNFEIGRLTLSHVTEYNKELDRAGIERGKTSPFFLPDYRYERALPRYQQ